MLRPKRGSMRRARAVALSAIVVLPTVVLSIVAFRLIDRSAHDETESLIRDSELVPWYIEATINRTLTAFALYAARFVGEDGLANQEVTHERLSAAGVDFFSTLTMDRAPREAGAEGSMLGTSL